MREHGLDLALQKTEIIGTSKKIEPVTMIDFGENLNYLGVIPDMKISFKEHMKIVPQNVARQVDDEPERPSPK